MKRSAPTSIFASSLAVLLLALCLAASACAKPEKAPEKLSFGVFGEVLIYRDLDRNGGEPDRTVLLLSEGAWDERMDRAARVMAGEKLSEMKLPSEDRELGRYCVKEAVMPFGRFPGTDSILGPEMKSTGEVMGVAPDFPSAYAKSQLAIDYSLPSGGTAFISVCDRDKRSVVAVARHLHQLGFRILSTRGTARSFRAAGIPVDEVQKVHEGRPNIVDALKNGEVQLVINTPFGRETRSDGYHIRTAAVQHGVSNITTLAAAQASVQAIEAMMQGRLEVIALQDMNGDLP